MLNPKEFEVGDTPLDIQVSPNLGIILSIRFTADEADEVFEAAESQGLPAIQLSHDLILQAVRSIPAREQRKQAK